MFTLQELNLVLGVGWDEQFDDRLDLTFHEQDGGFSEEVTVSCKRWHHRLPLTAPYRTAHLPPSMSFKLGDLRTLVRKLNNGYKNVNAILPLEFRSDGFEVRNGPARGTVIPVKR